MPDTMPQRPHQEALLRAALTEIAGHPAHDLEDSDLASQPTPEDGVRWQDQPTRTRWALPAAAATILALGAAALVATNEQFLGGAEDGIAANGTELAQVDVVPVGEGSMVRFASASAQDWTRNSDWVAEVAVTAEHPTAEVHGTEEGEGLVVTREVELTVQRVLWQRTAPAHELPRQLSLWAAGWTKSAESSSTLTLSRSRASHGWRLGTDTLSHWFGCLGHAVLEMELSRRTGRHLAQGPSFPSMRGNWAMAKAKGAQSQVMKTRHSLERWSENCSAETLRP